jgi:uncharacterized protein
MPEYLHPGVYIEEIERGPRPIEGVPTSTSVFLGQTERGPTRPRLVTSYKEFAHHFGGVFAPDKFMPYAANGFFENGGKRLYVARIVPPDASPASADFGAFKIRAIGHGSWGKRIFVKIMNSSTIKSDGNPVGFRVRIAYWKTSLDIFDPFIKDNNARLPRPIIVEDFDDLVTDEASPDYYGKRMPFIDESKGNKMESAEGSALAVLVKLNGTPIDAKPDISDTGKVMDAGGDDGAANLTPADFKGAIGGNREELQGLDALEQDPYRDVSLVYAPAASEDVIKLIVTHCEKMRFRFAVIDSAKSSDTPSGVDPRVKMKLDSQYAAFYFPWLVVSDPSTGARKMVPPGGYCLGIYSRSDGERGVYKAPANEIVRGALDLEYDISDEQQDTLNPRSVNAIRSFPGRGIRVWGARTLASNALWKYVSVRRLFIFLERSIYEGTQWVVFEPNDPRLWARVTDTIRLFLRSQWRQGALFGRTEEQAFFITCNETVMTQDDILNGRLICEIGIAPVRPAEFVIFRIFQHTAEAQQ